MSNTEASNVALPIAGYRSGTVALLGSANAGKSSIMNALVAKKISAVSPKPQTTRNRIVGVKHREDGELIIVDSPGFEGVKRNGALAQLLKRQLREAGSEIDYVAFVVVARSLISFSSVCVQLVAAVDNLTKNGKKLAEAVASKKNNVLAGDNIKESLNIFLRFFF